jgi:hypothetical protein
MQKTLRAVVFQVIIRLAVVIEAVLAVMPKEA